MYIYENKYIYKINKFRITNKRKHIILVWDWLNSLVWLSDCTHFSANDMIHPCVWLPWCLGDLLSRSKKKAFSHLPALHGQPTTLASLKAFPRLRCHVRDNQGRWRWWGSLLTELSGLDLGQVRVVEMPDLLSWGDSNLALKDLLIYIFFTLFYVWGCFATCVSRYHMHTWCPQRSEEITGSPGTGGDRECEASHGCWNLKPISLDQPMLLTTELYLQLQRRSFYGEEKGSTSIGRGRREPQDKNSNIQRCICVWKC